MNKLLLSVCLIGSAFAVPVFGQQDYVKSTILSRLKNSRDFSLKVADAMPDSDYGFKLTKDQMSFGKQMVHLGQSFPYFLSMLTGQKPEETKPTGMTKTDIVAFLKTSYDGAIDQVSKLSPEQIEKTYKSDNGSMSGLEDLIAMLEHAAHHRASAEMYLRAKGIKPPSYQD